MEHKTSLSRKITFYAILLLLFNLFITILITNVALSNYYVNTQEQIFSKIYKDMNNIKDYNSEEFKSIVKYADYNNMFIEIYDSSTNKRVYTPYRYDSEYFTQKPTTDSKSTFEMLLEGKECIIVKTDDVEKSDILSQLNFKYNQLSLLSRINDTQYMLIQTSYDALSQSVLIYLQFTLIAFSVSFIVVIIPVFIVGHTLVKPIKKVSKIAQNIANKDFSEKCTYIGTDEVGVLSESINKMSESIESYMVELQDKNEQLKLDIEKQMEIDASQKMFISNASHELKTPISIVSGYAEGIKYGLAETPEDREKYCDTIINECKRMTNIIKQLLDLSSIENKQYILNIEKNDITKMCHILYDKFLLTMKNNNIEFDINISDNLEAYCDYNEVEKILINFIQNAIKYGDKNGFIKINAYNESEYVYIGVENKGKNLEPDDMKKIWDRFYRLDKSRKRDENSTGLGLSIVKAIMELHNMPYGVKNTKIGVEFYIKLKKH